MTDQLDNQESLNSGVEADETAKTSETTEENEEVVDEEVAVKLKKTEEYAKNQKLRAEKAEQKLKALEKNKVEENETSVNSNYSLKDIRALAKVHDDDVDRVEKFAKAENIPIAEALKNDDLKAILKHREEQRKTAEAANTGGARRGSSKITDETILADFERGILPDTEEGIQRLAEAQMAQKKAMSKQELNR
jgi:hypothetical protein